MTKEKFLEKAREVFGYKYQYPNLNDRIMSSDSINILFQGKLYIQKVSKHLQGKQIEKALLCKSTSQFIKESQEIWGVDKYDYSKTVYTGALKKVKIIYQGIIFEQIAASHLRKMAPEDKLNQEIFLQKAKEKWGNKYDYSMVSFKSSHEKVQILYLGKVYEQTPSNHLKYKPEQIKLSKRKSNDDFIQESKEVHNNKYTYESCKYVKNNEDVIINCKSHGAFRIKPILHIQGNGCQLCLDSIIEKEVGKFLNQHKINYLRQFRFKDIHNLPFDFYIPSLRTCLDIEETDLIKKNMKNNFCEDNYIDLIQIKIQSLKNIETILKNIFKNKIKDI